MRGIGSPRFILNSASNDVTKKLPSDESMVKVSIELRPKGIIVHFKKFTEHYSWIIPYYKLTIYFSDYLSIYGEATFIKFLSKGLKKSHNKFLKKVLSLRANYVKNQLRV